MNITRRDIKFFFFGILTMILIEIIFNWADFKKGVQDGYSSIRAETVVKK